MKFSEDLSVSQALFCDILDHIVWIGVWDGRNMKLYMLLRSYRKQHHLLQKDMSALLGISREHYARVESGRIIPGVDLLTTISKKLHITIIIVLPPKDPIVKSLDNKRS